MTDNNAREIAILAAEAADDRKAENIKILQMPEIMVEAEYFVICSAGTGVQIRAIVDSITSSLEDKAELLRHEGRGNYNWVLLDYGHVIVHVFHEEDREYYALEKLWADAERIPWS